MKSPKRVYESSARHALSLEPNRPNPFACSTTLAEGLNDAAQVRLLR